MQQNNHTDKKSKTKACIQLNLKVKCIRFKLHYVESTEAQKTTSSNLRDSSHSSPDIVYIPMFRKMSSQTS